MGKKAVEGLRRSDVVTRNTRGLVVGRDQRSWRGYKWGWRIVSKKLQQLEQLDGELRDHGFEIEVVVRRSAGKLRSHGTVREGEVVRSRELRISFTGPTLILSVSNPAPAQNVGQLTR
jgi:hypothetical protein